MHRLTRLSAIALLALAATCPLRADDAKPAAPPAPLAKLELADGDSIVFLGDSITHQRLYTQYVEDYFYTRMPHLRLKMHNAGVGGARAWDALQRFDQDVAAYKPKYVTILLGMNDGTYRPYDEATFQTYRTDMSELLTQLEGIGAKPIPMTPTMYDARANRLSKKPRDAAMNELYNSVLAYYGTWLRDVAQENGYGFVDMWGPLNTLTLQERKKDPSFTLIADAVHPGPDGQVIMAMAIINDLGLPKGVSTITLNLEAKGKQQAKATGGAVSDLEITSDGVAFTWTAESLPWVVPPSAQKGAKLANIGHRLSREALEVHGLPNGQYTLTIDDVEVGQYFSGALEHHIELQSNDKTPQYQQALQVALFNQERNEGPKGNDGPIAKLRAEWSRFQQFARARRTVQEKPDDAEAKKQLATLEQQLAGIEDRVAQHNAEAKAIEDKIFEVNQPKARRYVLKQVAK